MRRRAKLTLNIICSMEETPISGGSTSWKCIMSRDNGLERQCRFYCTRCKLLVAYRQSPPGESSPLVVGMLDER